MAVNPYEPPQEQEPANTRVAWNAGDYVAFVLVPILIALMIAAMLLPAVN